MAIYIPIRCIRREGEDEYYEYSQPIRAPHPTKAKRTVQVGENVGVGGSVDEVHASFLGSTEHRRAILSRSYDSMGIGVAERNGQVWVVEVYRGG